jgi:hypothetical protein
MLFAQTYEELMQEAQAAERMGWIFAALGFAIIIIGVVYSIWFKGKKQNPTRNDRE